MGPSPAPCVGINMKAAESLCSRYVSQSLQRNTRLRLNVNIIAYMTPPDVCTGFSRQRARTSCWVRHLNDVNRGNHLIWQANRTSSAEQALHTLVPLQLEAVDAAAVLVLQRPGCLVVLDDVQVESAEAVLADVEQPLVHTLQSRHGPAHESWMTHTQHRG